MSATRVRPAADDAESERGSATVVVVGLLACALTLGIAGLTLAGVVLATHRARSAADLAALAGAARLVGASTRTTSSTPAAPATSTSSAAPVTRSGAGLACAAASAVARANRATPLTCAVEGAEVVVSVQVPTPGLAGRLGPAVAQARAGPPRESARAP
ncbi:pilus assembly protein TadG-related protein [Agilicoccus flavus]|uniref:pilus assembly protein TadG-related protein n=1 Tax=Agilicoccus flavus TaxID=2775968 RepID=UPI001CF6B319|nr:pilus assembly protein TadG-related protein [Agilicoccus flavus]